MIDEFGCTPSEAIRELRDNPYIWRLLAARAMERAHAAIARWEAASDTARETMEPPSGPWVRRVAGFLAEDVREEIAERKRTADRLRGVD